MRKISAVLLSVTLLLACSAQAGGPDGLYLMTRFAFGSLETKAYRFEDGVVVMNPIRPSDAVADERAQRPNDVGTYRIEGENLVVELGSTPTSAKFEPSDKGCFGWNGGIFCPVQPFDGSQTLDGTFEGGASVGGGAAMSSTTITFNDDGTYALSSTASFNMKSETSEVSTGGSGGERGTYALDGTALTLQPEGGEARVYSVFPYDDGTEGPAPRRLYFGGGMLKRAQ